MRNYFPTAVSVARRYMPARMRAHGCKIVLIVLAMLLGLWVAGDVILGLLTFRSLILL